MERSSPRLPGDNALGRGSDLDLSNLRVDPEGYSDIFLRPVRWMKDFMGDDTVATPPLTEENLMKNDRAYTASAVTSEMPDGRRVYNPCDSCRQKRIKVSVSIVFLEFSTKTSHECGGGQPCKRCVVNGNLCHSPHGGKLSRQSQPIDAASLWITAWMDGVDIKPAQTPPVGDFMDGDCAPPLRRTFSRAGSSARSLAGSFSSAHSSAKSFISEAFVRTTADSRRFRTGPGISKTSVAREHEVMEAEMRLGEVALRSMEAEGITAVIKDIMEDMEAALEAVQTCPFTPCSYSSQSAHDMNAHLQSAHKPAATQIGPRNIESWMTNMLILPIAKIRARIAQWREKSLLSGKTRIRWRCVSSPYDTLHNY
jgi:hypothetical protein